MLSNLASWPETAESSDVLAGLIGGLVATNCIELFNFSDPLQKLKPVVLRVVLTFTTRVR
jgi:NAD(P)H-hydrate repair Nnr-like enzyme with NAD(P)H-hydrate dehydratase domain